MAKKCTETAYVGYFEPTVCWWTVTKYCGEFFLEIGLGKCSSRSSQDENLNLREW